MVKISHNVKSVIYRSPKRFMQKAQVGQNLAYFTLEALSYVKKVFPRLSNSFFLLLSFLSLKSPTFKTHFSNKKVHYKNMGSLKAASLVLSMTITEDEVPIIALKRD